MKMVQWLMLSSLVPSLMNEIKNLMTLSFQTFPFSPLVVEVWMQMVWLMLSSLFPYLMGEVKNLMTLSL